MTLSSVYVDLESSQVIWDELSLLNLVTSAKTLYPNKVTLKSFLGATHSLCCPTVNHSLLSATGQRGDPAKTVTPSLAGWPLGPGAQSA